MPAQNGPHLCLVCVRTHAHMLAPCFLWVCVVFIDFSFLAGLVSFYFYCFSLCGEANKMLGGEKDLKIRENVGEEKI